MWTKFNSNLWLPLLDTPEFRENYRYDADLYKGVFVT